MRIASKMGRVQVSIVPDAYSKARGDNQSVSHSRATVREKRGFSIKHFIQDHASFDQ
jgi:hypothetical protein